MNGAAAPPVAAMLHCAPMIRPYSGPENQPAIATARIGSSPPKATPNTAKWVGIIQDADPAINMVASPAINTVPE